MIDKSWCEHLNSADMTEQQDWLKSLVEKRGYCTVAEILLDKIQKLLSLFTQN